MTTKVDEVEKKEDKAKDESSDASSPEVKQSSQPKLSADAEAEVKKRVSDILAKKGDEAKTLRAEVDDLKVKEKVREDVRLKEAAERHGLTVEDLTKAGYDNADKVEAGFNLFGGTREPVKEPSPTPDSGKTMGGKGILKASEVVASLDPTINTPKEIHDKVVALEKAEREGTLKE